jgi:hypothetical protein
MNDELERISKEAVVAWPRYYPIIFLKGLRKTMNNLSQKSWCPGQDSNQAPTEYMSRVLPLNKSVRCMQVLSTYSKICECQKYERQTAEFKIFWMAF